MFDWLSDIIVSRKRVSFVLALLLVVVSFAGLARISVDNDYRKFIPEGDAAIAMSDWLAERQDQTAESLILIYQPADEEALSATSLIQYGSVADLIRSWPEVYKVDSLFDQEKLIRVTDENGNQSYRAASVLVGGDVFGPNGSTALERDLAALPTVSKRYLGADNESLALVVFLRDDENYSPQDGVERLLDRLDQAELQLSEVRDGDGLLLAGTVMFEHEASEVLRKDIRAIFPIALLLVSLLIYLVYRSALFVPFALLIIVLPIGATAGTSGWIGLALSNLSVSALLLVGTLAVADVMHVSNTFFATLRETGDKDGALRQAVRSNFIIIAMTTVTTALGQVALLVSPAEPIQVMGTMIVIGAFMALIIAILMLPLVLSWLPTPSRVGADATLARWLSNLARWSYDRPVRVLVTSSLILLIAGVGLMRAEMSDSLEGWFSENTSFNQSMNELNGNYLGSDTISIAIEATADDLLAPRFWPEETPEVSLYLNAHDTLEQSLVDGELLSPISAVRASAEILEFEDSTLEFLGSGSEYERFSTETVARSGLMTRYYPGRKDYSIWYYDGDGSSSFRTSEDGDDIRESLAELVENREVRVGGIGLALADLSVNNFFAVAWGSLLTFVLISIAMFGVFRDLRLGLISIAPNLAPILVGLGIWGLLVGHVNMAAVTVFSVSMGIVVDDSIHTIMKFQSFGGLRSKDPGEAFAKAMESCAVGIATTTVVLAIGFFLLATSDFLLTAQKSLLVGVVIVFAFLFDLIVLPALLSCWNRWSRRKNVSAARRVAT